MIMWVPVMSEKEIVFWETFSKWKDGFCPIVKIFASINWSQRESQTEHLFSSSLLIMPFKIFYPSFMLLRRPFNLYLFLNIV
jgi:hypothetical protein